MSRNLGDLARLAGKVAAERSAAIAALQPTRRKFQEKTLESWGRQKEIETEIKQLSTERTLARGNPNDLYPTPVELAERLVSYIGIEAGASVLEPSAGTGRLAEAARREGAHVFCVEWNYNAAKYLSEKGFEVYQGDFLTWKDDRKFDYVIMNPPFSRLADCDHIMHAATFLKPNGTLGAICSASTEYNSTNKARQFRDWLDNQMMLHDESLPAGTFKASGTDIRSRMIILRVD
jgi:16S rRNA G966 N2-methylase RsmD